VDCTGDIIRTARPQSSSRAFAFQPGARVSLPSEEFMNGNTLLTLALALVLAVPALAADIA
jgi:hypothetical protein